MEKNTIYMKKAIAEAKKASIIREVPVGAIIVKDGKIIARGYNKRESTNDATSHAEMTAIKKACKKLNSWRLVGCDLYVTLEPCPMCSGAIINSRIENVYFGSYDYKSGSFGSVTDLSKVPEYNHHPNVFGGILQEECLNMISDFFKKLRKGEI